MKKLSIIGISALLATVGAAAVGCSSDSDNPGQGTAGETSDGGKGSGTAGKGNAGKGNTGGGGKGSTGGAGKDSTGGAGEGGEPAGGTTGGDGGTVGEGGEGGTTTEPTACDIYADRAGGVKEIPHDADGNITSDLLTADTIWTLGGRWFVKSGKTLTIEPCTLVEASAKPNAGSLIVPQGAKIHAVGTPNAPIVFSTLSHTFQAGAPWGGIILVGKASVARRTSAPAAEYTRTFEGYTDPRTQFGLVDPTKFDDQDSSGEMQYVRIEFGGDIIVSSKEINGLSLCGVGAGTTLDHIMVKDQQDDCFEFFGGTVNANHLICQNSGDDMFDTDLGYKGNMQYLFGRNLALGTSSDPNGFEWDGDQDDLTAPETEASMPHVSNVTMCGVPGPSRSYGAVIRRNIATGTSILNTIVTGFDNGLDFRNKVGTNPAPRISWTNSLFFGQLKQDGQNDMDENTVAGDDGFLENDYLAVAANANTVGGTAPAGFDCYSTVPKSPTTAIVGGTPAAPFNTSAKFVGAGDFARDGWNAGSWIEWVSE